MTHAVRIHETGGPDVFRWEPIEVADPGPGEALVRHAVERARESGTRILPLCPFAKAQIARHPEWQDVLT